MLAAATRIRAQHGEIRVHGDIVRSSALRAVCEDLLREYQLQDSMLSESGGATHAQLEIAPGCDLSHEAGHCPPASPKPANRLFAAGPASLDSPTTKATALKGKQSQSNRSVYADPN